MAKQRAALDGRLANAGFSGPVSFMSDYDALWEELRAEAAYHGTVKQGRAARLVPTRERPAIVAAMASLAATARAHYAAIPGEGYRTAMWRRRQFIHEQGGTDGVWDGTDPVDWQRYLEAGRVGVVPAGFAGRPQ